MVCGSSNFGCSVTRMFLVALYACVSTFQTFIRNVSWFASILHRFERKRYGCILRTWRTVDVNALHVKTVISTSLAVRCVRALGVAMFPRRNHVASMVKESIEAMDSMKSKDNDREVVHFVELFDGRTLLVRNSTSHFLESDISEKKDVYGMIIATIGEGRFQIDISQLFWKYHSSLTSENGITGNQLMISGLLLGDTVPTYGHLASIQATEPQAMSITDLNTLDVHKVDVESVIVVQ